MDKEMLKVKSTLSIKDKKVVENILAELTDIFGDFYITKNNMRLYIKENKSLLFECLRKGDKIVFDEDGQGLAIITGWSDKAPRKYIKILSKDLKITDKLLKIIDWNIPEDVYIKIKKNNPIKPILLKNKYKFIGDRGKEILFMKEGVEYPNIFHKYEEE
jgi:hypothetical protein